MDQLFKETLWKNFAAEIDMLKNVIEVCPDPLWLTDNKIFYMTYHTVIFLDYYLSVPAKDFSPQLPYDLVPYDQLPADAVDDVIPRERYSKLQLYTYLHTIRIKCSKLINDTTAEDFSKRWIKDEEVGLHGLCPSVVEQYNVLEIIFYNFRHVQHHIGQLNLLLRQRANTAADWVAEAQ